MENREYKKFNSVMDVLLKVPPKAVKDAMDADKKIRAERKAKAASGRVSRAKD